MVGYRKTHKYAHGTPFPLVLLGVPMAVLLVLWVFMVPGHWPRAIGIIALVLLIAFINTNCTHITNEPGKQCEFRDRESLSSFRMVYPFPCWRPGYHSLSPSQS